MNLINNLAYLVWMSYAFLFFRQYILYMYINRYIVSGRSQQTKWNSPQNKVTVDTVDS